MASTLPRAARTTWSPGTACRTGGRRGAAPGRRSVVWRGGGACPWLQASRLAVQAPRRAASAWRCLHSRPLAHQSPPRGWLPAWLAAGRRLPGGRATAASWGGWPLIHSGRLQSRRRARTVSVVCWRWCAAPHPSPRPAGCPPERQGRRTASLAGAPQLHGSPPPPSPPDPDQPCTLPCPGVQPSRGRC